MHVSKRMKVKAVLQTNQITGVSRVFYRKKINGKTRIVLKEVRPTSSYRVTGYNSMSTVLLNLTKTVPVHQGEQVMFEDQPCEHLL